MTTEAQIKNKFIELEAAMTERFYERTDEARGLALAAARDMVIGTLPNADIIFITDGECQTGVEFIRRFTKDKQDHNIKVIGVQIGEGQTDSLKTFSDATFRLSAARGAAGVEAIIQEMK